MGWLTGPRSGGRCLGLGVVVTFMTFGVGAAESAVRADSTQYLPRPHFDVRNMVRPVSQPSATQTKTVAALGARMQFNPRTGGPFVIMKDSGALTRPSNGSGARIARKFLRLHASLYGLSAADVDGLVGSAYTTKHNGATQVTFSQRSRSRAVYDSALKVTVDKKGRVVIVTGTLFPEAQTQVRGGARLDAEAAVLAAAKSLGIKVSGPLQALPGKAGVAHFRNTIARGISRPYDITAELVTFPVGRQQPARLGWKIGLETDPWSDYELVIDAQTGGLLYKDNGVADADGTVYTAQHPGVSGAARSDVAFPASWMSASAATSGPNVNAYQDLTETNSVEYQTTTPAFPDPGFQRYNFAFANDWALNGPHSLQPAGAGGYVDIDAISTQLFYYTNVMHDFLVGFGFNSGSKNFEGADPVLAEATDGYDNGVVTHCTDQNGNPIRCVNNANFNTQPDGTSPRMQMFMWESPQRDGSLDGDVIAHEYGHGLSGRLIANGNLGSTVQTGALGEGWSDITSASKWDDPVIGEYVTGNSTRGIRFYSMASSPLKYSNLCNVTSGCEVHADGEIWTAAFWDMRTKLVARYGDPAGKTLAFQLIVDGMKNTAKNPTFLSARDGILAADVTDKGGADTCLIWGAYAGRQMGFSATTTGNADMNPVVATDGPSSCTPVASIGGPYVTNEGTDAVLNAGGSTENGDGPFTYAWDFDNDGQYDDATGKTPSFTSVGQDGVYPIGLKVTNADGFSSTASTSVTVNNIAPSVAVANDGPRPENTTVTVSGVVSDPGWLDPLTATIDWGDGAVALPGVLENVRPDATLTFSATHVYGDNGLFTVTVCAADDDTSNNCNSTLVSVTNVNPTAVIDKSGAIVVNGMAAFIGHEGVPMPFAGDSFDPGSDDRTTTWNWGDLTPVVSSLSLNDPGFNPDPFPSPTINPRTVHDAKSHTFGDACFYTITFSARDDDAGLSPVDHVAVVIAGNSGAPSNAGYWQTQYRPRPTAFTEARRQCYLAITGFMSAVFDEVRDASTVAKAFDVLFVGGNGGSPVQQLDRQLLTAWLNFANGGFEYTQLVDTDGNGIPDTAFSAVLANAESIRLNPASTPDQLRAQRDLLERINA